MYSVGIVSLFPEMFDALNYGVTGKAISRELLNISYWNPRDYTQDAYKKVDDRPFGGGPGMVLMYQPVVDAITAAKEKLGQNAPVIYLSAQGKPLKQKKLENIVAKEKLILVAGRYEGIDERIITNKIDEEWSIGDYVLSGGELAAMVVVDGITRLLRGALGDSASNQQDSFSQELLDCPHYTRPASDGNAIPPIPEVLASGDHAAINEWRLQQALGYTWLKRPDLLEKYSLTDNEKKLLNAFIRGKTNE